MAAAPTSADAAPRTVKIGALVTAAGDFDVDTRSFRATLWVFTTVPTSTANPLNEIDWVNAKSITTTASIRAPKPNGSIGYQKKIDGIFSHNWDLQWRAYLLDAIYCGNRSNPVVGRVVLPAHFVRQRTTFRHAGSVGICPGGESSDRLQPNRCWWVAHIMFNRGVSAERINRIERRVGIASTGILIVLLVLLFLTRELPTRLGRPQRPRPVWPQCAPQRC